MNLEVGPFAQLTVGVLMGGQSTEREVSLRSGRGVLGALERLGIAAVPIDPGPDLPLQLREAGVDVVFNILHGGPGENGAVQGLLDAIGMPYTGSGVLASAIAMNKLQTKRILRAEGIPTPDWLAFSCDDDPAEAARAVEDVLGLPAVVKPVDQGSSVGVSIPKSRDQAEGAIGNLLAQFGACIVEKFIRGREITVGIIGWGERLRALPVLELRPKREFYDYVAKYTKGMTDLIVPAPLSEEQTALAQQVALAAHQAVGCHGWSRVDMHIDEDGQVWVHEINSIPGMTETSDVPAEARAAGMSYDELVLEILWSAVPRLEQKRRLPEGAALLPM